MEDIRMSTKNSTDVDKAYERGVHDGQDAGLIDKVAQRISDDFSISPSDKDQAYRDGYWYGTEHPPTDSGGSDSGGSGSGSSGGSSCFISSACIEAAGLPDNCYELETLRQYRESYVAKLPEGPALLAEYRKIAPTIVRRLRGTDRLTRLFTSLVRPSVNLIEQDKPAEALRLYMLTVRLLKQQLNLPNT